MTSSHDVHARAEAEKNRVLSIDPPIGTSVGRSLKRPGEGAINRVGRLTNRGSQPPIGSIAGPG